MFKYLNKYSELTNKRTQTIGVFIKDYSVSADIRLLSIFDMISEQKKFEFYIIEGKDLLNVEKDLLNNNFFFNTIVIQRNALDQNNNVKSNLFELIVNYCKENHIKIIYEIDDDLLNIDKSNPGYEYYRSIKPKMEHLIKNSDTVTVSTETLKKTLTPLNKNIIVIPNRLIDNWFNKVPYNRTKNKNQIIIGYMGTIYHTWDLVLLETAINNVKKYFSKQNKEIIFELVGVTDQELDWVKKVNVPKEKERYLKFVPWLKSVANWDIAVAPLENSAINLNKSELKYLEYTGLNIPGIYSAVGPYKEKIIDGETGILIKTNTPEEWEKRIINLIEDKNLQKKIIKNAKNNIIDKYLINRSINQWVDLLSKYIIQEKYLTGKYTHKINKFKEKYLNTNEKLNILEITSKFSDEINQKTQLNEKNWEYTKLFINKNGNQIITNYYELKKIKNNSIDAIIVLEFFSIFDYFWLAIKEFNRILKKNGYIHIIITKNNPSFKLTKTGLAFFAENNNLTIINENDDEINSCIILQKLK